MPLLVRAPWRPGWAAAAAGRASGALVELVDLFPTLAEARAQRATACRFLRRSSPLLSSHRDATVARPRPDARRGAAVPVGAARRVRIVSLFVLKQRERRDERSDGRWTARRRVAELAGVPVTTDAALARSLEVRIDDSAFVTFPFRVYL